MKSFIRQLPSMGRVHQESIDLAVPFYAVASKFSGLTGTVVLMSGTTTLSIPLTASSAGALADQKTSSMRPSTRERP